MVGKGRAISLVVLAGAAVAAYFAWQYAKETRDKAEKAADEIEEQLLELDPVTRAAVVARLGSRARNVLPRRS
jgi:flagellar basal body-associated protein FliL